MAVIESAAQTAGFLAVDAKRVQAMLELLRVANNDHGPVMNLTCCRGGIRRNRPRWIWQGNQRRRLKLKRHEIPTKP